MEVNKAEASKILGCSLPKIVRMIKSGELTAKRRGPSKFSDWVITLPDSTAVIVDENKTVEQKVSEVLKEVEVQMPEKPIAKEAIMSPKEIKQVEEEHAEAESVEVDEIEEIKEEEKGVEETTGNSDSRRKGESGSRKSTKWWF